MSSYTVAMETRENQVSPEIHRSKRSSLVRVEELTKIMVEHSLRDNPNVTVDRSTRLIKAYLFKNEPEFVRLMEFRERGWIENKEMGDAFFKEQRARADNADKAGEYRFYIMMQQIADEMHRCTGVFSVPPGQGHEVKVLDICAAPGGYTAAALRQYPNAKAFVITLPTEQGGHPLHVNKSRLAGLQYLDVTMLAAEFTNNPVPQDHPEREKFLTIRPFRFHKFDLIFCDGMVLRTHKRSQHREDTEVNRLSCSQLIIAMQRVRTGGSVVMLLHKIDSYAAASILYTFSKFATVQAFKPERKHATRSSFYMVASNLQPEKDAAKAAVKEWKDVWYEATFGGETGTGERREDPPEDVICTMLEEFGERLMEMGRPVWRTQADALSKTAYAGDGSSASNKGLVDPPSPGSCP